MIPKVSVIIPVYNVEQYLPECLESVIGQTLEDIEIICVNDGSTDSSGEILRNYAKKDKRIKIIEQKNSGYGAAMNRGLDEASGKYVGIVESDDYVLPEMFEKLYLAAEKNNAEVVKGDYMSFCGSGENRKFVYNQMALGKSYYGKLLDSTKTTALFYCIMMSWEGIYRRSFLDGFRIRHNESAGASFQDNGFWFQVFARACRVYFINEANYMYRIDSASSSVSNRNKTFCVCGEYEYIRDFLNKWPELKQRLLPTYYYFYFVNLLSRLSHAAKDCSLEFAEHIKSEFSAMKAEKRWRKELFPPFMLEYLSEIEENPAKFIAEDKPSIDKICWAEVEHRLSAKDLVAESVVPESVLKSFEGCVIHD